MVLWQLSTYTTIKRNSTLQLTRTCRSLYHYIREGKSIVIPVVFNVRYQPRYQLHSKLRRLER